ncbi:dynein regulatory complex protein 9-like isoform X1 [Drosophila montana]|uniref:dynein regulatory complex protein 9-like isoform X1 n=1 Tax=Drosophila montana TaxID=40370 RepID=UPI00313A9771
MRQSARPYEWLRWINLDFSSLRTTIIENVLRAMNEAYERVKISLILPKLIEDRQMLAKVVTGTQFEGAIPLINDFLRRRDIILKEHRPPLMDHGMVKIIDYFQRNQSIYTLFPQLMNSMSDNERKLVVVFQKLIDMAKAHLERDAKAQIQQERYLQGVYAENEKLKENIKQIEDQIAAHRIELRWKAAAKKSYLAKIAEELRVKKEQHEEKIERETERYRRSALANVRNSQDKQIELAEDLEKIRFESEKLDRDNKKLEKEGRDEKNKLQIQLQGIIRKYDTVIGEKLVENLDLTDLLNEAKKKLDEYMVTYRKEQAIYNEIVVKREKAEERKRQQAILHYMMHRAACKIQRYWRAWRKHLQKKNRRGKRK